MCNSCVLTQCQSKYFSMPFTGQAGPKKNRSISGTTKNSEKTMKNQEGKGSKYIN